jgi:hypothetical protein
MFLMVYFHHKSVVYEELLRRHVAGADVVPADLDAYLGFDDVTFQGWLRAQAGPAARRIVEHRPFRRFVERQGAAGDVDLAAEDARLRRLGIDVIHTTSTQRLSRYVGPADRRRRAMRIGVVDAAGSVVPLDEASRVFRRYEEAHVIGRIYVAPEKWEAATAALATP